MGKLTKSEGLKVLLRIARIKEKAVGWSLRGARTLPEYAKKDLGKRRYRDLINTTKKEMEETKQAIIIGEGLLKELDSLDKPEIQKFTCSNCQTRQPIRFDGKDVYLHLSLEQGTQCYSCGYPMFLACEEGDGEERWTQAPAGTLIKNLLKCFGE